MAPLPLLALLPLLAGGLPGCAASSSRPHLDLSTLPAGPARADGSTDALDLQQLSGQIVAGVQAELSSRVEAAISAALDTHVQATGVAGDVTGYRSEFGFGAVIIVALALVLAMMTLLLTIVLSHRRETLRISRTDQRPTDDPPCSS